MKTVLVVAPLAGTDLNGSDFQIWTSDTIPRLERSANRNFSQIMTIALSNRYRILIEDFTGDVDRSCGVMDKVAIAMRPWKQDPYRGRSGTDYSLRVFGWDLSTRCFSDNNWKHRFEHAVDWQDVAGTHSVGQRRVTGLTNGILSSNVPDCMPVPLISICDVLSGGFWRFRQSQSRNLQRAASSAHSYRSCLDNQGDGSL
jgi:hypothetical protein